MKLEEGVYDEDKNFTQELVDLYRKTHMSKKVKKDDYSKVDFIALNRQRFSLQSPW